MNAWEGFTSKLVAAAEARTAAAKASETSRQSEVRAALIAADASHARRLQEAEDAYRQAVTMSILPVQIEYPTSPLPYRLRTRS